METELTEGQETNGIVTTAVSPPHTEKPKEKSLQSLLKDPTYKKKFIHTMWLYYSLFMLGFVVGQKGPTFLDLQIITNTDMETASAFFTSASIGYLVGAMIFGILFDKFSTSILLFLSCFGMAISVAILPFCSLYFLMIAITFIAAVFMKGLDTVGNADVVGVWGKEGTSYVQAFHFAFALGGVMSPLVAEPFLTPKSEENGTVVDSAFQMSENYSVSVINLSAYTPFSNSINSTVELFSVPHEGKTTIVYIAFLIAAAFSLLSSVPYLIDYCKEKSKPKMREAGREQQSKRDIPFTAFIFTLVLACLFFMSYCAAEDTFAAYLMTFLVKGLDWSKELTPLWYTYLLLAESTFSFGVFLCLLLFARTYLKRKRQVVVSTLEVNPGEGPSVQEQLIEDGNI